MEPPPASTLRWLPPVNFPRSRSRSNTPSTSPNAEITALQADVKKVLDLIAASHQEQKKTSKSVQELATKVNLLERILCGDVDVGLPTKEILPGIVHHGGITRCLVDMEAAIDDLLGLVTHLKTDPRPPVVYRDAGTSPCLSFQNVHTDTHNPDLLETRPPPCSSFSLAPVDWNANPPNSRCTPFSAFSANQRNRSLASFLPTPFPSSTRGESFNRANDLVDSGALASLQLGLGSFEQNTSSDHMPTISADVALTPARSRIPPQSGSHHSALPLKSTALSSLTPAPSYQNLPASDSPQSSHFTSPTRMPSYALLRARATSLSRLLLETQPNARGYVDCEGLCVDCRAERREREDVEPCAPDREVADVDPDESMQLDRVSDVGGSMEVKPNNQRVLGHQDTGEEDLQTESEGEDMDGSLDEPVKSMGECSPTALAPNTGNPSQQYKGRPSEHPQGPLTHPVDNVQPENDFPESCEPIPSDSLPFDADPLDQYELLYAEDSREPTPMDSLFEDEDAVAAELAVDSSDSACTYSPQHLSTFLPLRSELQAGNEHVCPGTQDQGHGTTEPREESNHDNEGHLVAPNSMFVDPFSDYIDGPTSALRSTYAEMYANSQVRELAATIDQEHVEISARPEDVNPGHTVTATTLPHSTSPFSLSPLSSLVGSPPPFEMEGDGWNGKGVELRRTESLHSDADFGTRARSGSSVSAPQKKETLRATGPRKLRGGPGASIKELSVLARRNPPKLNINLSDLKRKLESSEFAKRAKKKTRFDKDAVSMPDIMAPIENPMRSSSRLCRSMQDVTSSPVENNPKVMEVDSASGAAMISEPATEMERIVAPANELQVDPTEGSKIRRRLKARESTAQKVRQPGKNASGTPTKRSPQKRKSLPSQDEGLMCQWPAKSEQNGSFQRQFVQCDNCDLWYHFGCVGMIVGDSRLEGEATFICPPCCVSTAKRVTLRNRAEMCARPDCFHANLDVQEYVIERLVGRKAVGQAGYLFLVKWEGYSIAQATWTPEGNLGGAAQTLDRFAADAKAEGIDLRKRGIVLLEEARVGGWEE